METDFQQVITWMDWATIIFAFFAMFGTGFNWWNTKKQHKQENEKIKIIFDVGGVDYILDLDMPRKHISRSEIQGILAAFQNDIKARYSIDYLSDLTFLDDIFKVQQNEISCLRIVLSENEFSQFNIKKMKQI
jgi:hypothetical protein